MTRVMHWFNAFADTALCGTGRDAQEVEKVSTSIVACPACTRLHQLDAELRDHLENA